MLHTPCCQKRIGLLSDCCVPCMIHQSPQADQLVREVASNISRPLVRPGSAATTNVNAMAGPRLEMICDDLSLLPGMSECPAGYVLDAACFVYTCRRLIDLSRLIAGTRCGTIEGGMRTDGARASNNGRRCVSRGSRIDLCWMRSYCVGCCVAFSLTDLLNPTTTASQIWVYISDRSRALHRGRTRATPRQGGRQSACR